MLATCRGLQELSTQLAAETARAAAAAAAADAAAASQAAAQRELAATQAASKSVQTLQVGALAQGMHAAVHAVCWCGAPASEHAACMAVFRVLVWSCRTVCCCCTPRAWHLQYAVASSRLHPNQRQQLHSGCK